MIALLWLGLTFAGDPPADVDLDDLVGYSDRARTPLQGPPGCWEVRGYVVWATWAQGGMRADSESPFLARLENGTWQRLPAGSPFRPLVGRAPGPAGTVQTLANWLETLTGDAETEYLAWDADRDAVVLIRDAPLDSGRSAQARTVFRDEGPLLDVVFPRHRLGPGTLLMGAGYDVRTRTQDGTVLPAEESLVFRVREHGKVVRGHQTVRYDAWSRCGT